MDQDLAGRLVELGNRIVVPHEEDGTPATLTALMPCEPAIGEVAVACWTDGAGGELVELVRLDDGARVDDPVALREALTLLAMVETVEDLAAFDELDAIAGALRSWSAPQGEPAEALDVPRASACGALEALSQLAPGELRMARPQRLDELGGALRELERTWAQLEAASELWCDELLARRGNDEHVVVEAVQSLWRVLGSARRGPLSQPVATALHEGREAGVSMAAAVTGR
jgi:hypothetical protein